MIRMFVRHDVADFATWKRAYDGFDGFDGRRRYLGVRRDAVFQAADDPNDVTAWHDVDSIQSARAFGALARGHAGRSRCGRAADLVHHPDPNPTRSAWQLAFG
jgi:hypothetical protein